MGENDIHIASHWYMLCRTQMEIWFFKSNGSNTYYESTSFAEDRFWQLVSSSPNIAT